MREGGEDETKHVQNDETIIKQNKKNYKGPKTRQQYIITKQHWYSLTKMKAQQSSAADRRIRKNAQRVKLADLAKLENSSNNSQN